ncbi:TRAP transporter small permease [Moorellaceae bacterium AZ2]
MSEKPRGSRTTFAVAEVVLSKVVWALSIASTVCLAAIMLIAVIDIVGTKFFRQAFPGAPEFIQSLNAPLVFLAVAFVQLDRGHTRIELLQQRMPRVIKHGIRLTGNILGIIICFVFGWRGFVYMQECMLAHKTAGGAVQFPIWPFVATLMVGYFLLALAFIVSLMKEVGSMASQGEPQ